MNTEDIPYDKPAVWYICEECGKGLSTTSALLSHQKWKHETKMELTCNSCQKTLYNKYSLMRHLKACRGPQGTTHSHNTNVLKIKCSLCDLTASSRVTLHDHYQTDHNIDLDEQHLTFDSIEDFYIWKDQFESDTKSNFVKTSGTRQGKNSTQIDKYVCHRDGNFQSKSKNIRNIKIIKSNKIGSYCPARIYVYISNENVTVKYIARHFGHENEVGRLYIPKLEKKRIAQKIAQKIPFDEILNEIHDSTSDKAHRLHLLKRQDLRNIATTYNLNQNDLHQNDYKSVDAQVYSSKLIRFYMAQGEHFEILDEDAIKCDFEKAKRDLLGSFLKTLSGVKTEEQLQAVCKQIAPLDIIIKSISKNNNMLGPAISNAEM